MSITAQPHLGNILREHIARIRDLERGGSNWIYVGSLGLDGVDEFIGPESPPFLNGWTNALGVEAPVAFTRINGWVHIRGGFVGGAGSTTVFVLPPAYRPAFRHRSVIGTSAVNHYATVYIEPTGEVVFGTVV